MKIRKAMILAAGFGKRLTPITDKLPKPLITVNNITLLENTLRFLKIIGIEEIAINVHYLANQIINFIKKLENNYNIKIFEEDFILGTGGGIFNCLPFFKNENFLVVNCDTIWNHKYKIPFDELKLKMTQKNAHIGMLVLNKNYSFDTNLKGDFAKASSTSNFILKKDLKNNNLIYTGCQIINPIVFKGQKEKIFPINLIWENEINKKKIICQTDDQFSNFYHVTNIKIYNLIKNLKITDL